MPYINQKDRKKFEEALSMIPDFETKGELEYVVYVIMKLYMSTREYRYSQLHDCCYAIQHCSDEFRRRFLDVRENEARKTNGDIDA